jgi:DNA-directed RNA polymerase III subunit RPC6
MTGEESMVLSHIQASGNEGARSYCSVLRACVHSVSGIWTKHIKVKTELHQTVLDRCLKSLVQKQRIKAVKSVKESRLPSQVS